MLNSKRFGASFLLALTAFSMAMPYANATQPTTNLTPIGIGTPGNITNVNSSNPLPVSVGNSSSAPVAAQVGDGTNQITLTTANSDAANNTSTRLPVNSRVEGFNGTSWDRLRAGQVGPQYSLTGVLNTLPVIRYNASGITLLDGQVGSLQADSTGFLKTNVSNPSSNPVFTKLGDGTNLLTLTTANSDASSNTSNRVPVNSRIEGFNGTGWDRLRSGVTGVQSSLTGFLNVIPMGRYNVTAPSPADGNMVPLQVDPTGALRTNNGFYGTTPVETTVSVSASTSTQLVAANAARTSLLIQNQDSTNPIYISFSGGTAVTTGTSYKLAAGAYIELKDGTLTFTAVNAIATGGAVTVYIKEGS